MSYTDTELLEILREFYVINGRVPKMRELSGGDFPSYMTYRKRFGSIQKAFDRASLPHNNFYKRPKSYDSVNLISILLKWYSKNMEWPKYSDFNKSHDSVDIPHVRTYENHFGSYSNAIYIARVCLLLGDTPTDDDIKMVVEDYSNMSKNKTRQIKLTESEIRHLLHILDEVYCHVCEGIIKKLRGN